MKTSSYPMLDGLRGIAAVFVVLRHTPAYWPFQVERSYLAVDLFFLLSGFVIAHAYEHKLLSGRMPLRQFAVVRLIRFYPMYAIALAVAVLGIVLRQQLGSTGIDGRPWSHVAASVALEAFFLPTPPSIGSSLDPQLFTVVGGVTWTLAWELLINLVYAAGCRVLRQRVLVGAVAVLALGLLWIGHFKGNLDAGFLWLPGHLAAAALRSSFGILCGVLLYRHRARLWQLLPAACRHPALAVVLLVAALACPAVPRGNWIVDAVLVLAVFPLTIVVATSRMPRRGLTLWTALGQLSFPLYLLHLSVGKTVESLAPEGVVRWAPLSGVLLLAVLMVGAWWIERHIDQPLRTWLTERLVRRAASAPAAAATAPR